MNPKSKKSPISAAIKNKNIVTVGRLKEIIKSNNKDKERIEGVRKAIGDDMSDFNEADVQDQVRLAQIEDQNRRYGAMIKNPERFKPKAIVKTTIIKKVK